MKTARLLTAFSVSAVMLFTGCSAESAGTTDANKDRDWGECTPAGDSQPLDEVESAEDEDKSVTVAAFNGWDETIATAHLAKYLLENNYDYSVEVKMFDLAPGFVATANGDVDWMSSSMLPVTHAKYIEKYQNKLEEQGCWYDQAQNVVAVNEDAPITKLSELKKHKDDFGGEIVGIEKGSGLMDAMENDVIPEYGLDNFNLISSSTPAMLAALSKAESSGDNIAVTLWHPHWAYDAFKIRDLEDDLGAFGKPDFLYSFSRVGFTDEHPQAAQALKNLALTPERLQSLEKVMAKDYDGKEPQKAVDEWAQDNQDFFDEWQSGDLSTDS